MRYSIILLVVAILFPASAFAEGDVIVNGFATGPTAVGGYSIFCDAGSCATSIAFPGRAASAPVYIFWLYSGFTPTPLSLACCPGTASNPQAASTCLCIYEAFRSNVAGRGACSHLAIGPCSFFNQSADDFGAVLLITPSAPGLTVSVGTWAFTP